MIAAILTLLRRLFRAHKIADTVSCPRCLGKGYVDANDIKRLKRELIWLPGSCAYCNGSGLVKAHMMENVSADEAALHADLTLAERKLLIKGGAWAKEYKGEFEQATIHVVAEIQRQYFQEERAPEEIVEFFFDYEDDFTDEERYQKKVAFLEYVHFVLSHPPSL